MQTDLAPLKITESDAVTTVHSVGPDRLEQNAEAGSDDIAVRSAITFPSDK